MAVFHSHSNDKIESNCSLQTFLKLRLCVLICTRPWEWKIRQLKPENTRKASLHEILKPSDCHQSPLINWMPVKVTCKVGQKCVCAKHVLLMAFTWYKSTFSIYIMLLHDQIVKYNNVNSCMQTHYL